MSARVLFISDMHKGYKDPSSIKGRLVVQQRLQDDIIQFNKANNVTHNVIMGDWYDRGFHGLGQAYGSIEMDRRLSESVNGNVYLCIGNHFYLERDENPEMYIIQPNKYIKPQIDIPVPNEPIFKLVPKLRVGPVQINFFHFNKLNKEYIAPRDSDTKFNIGVYHDDTVIPGWVREQEGYTGSATQAYFNQIYSNIDLALHGHIHTKIGAVTMDLLSGKKVPMFIPGVMCTPENKESFKHTDIQLPLVDIEDDGSVKIRQATFKTYVSDMRFFSQNKTKKKTVVATPEEVLTANVTTPVSQAVELQSLPVFLTKKGYGNRHLNLVNAAIADTLNIATAVRILAEVDEIHE